MNRKKCFVAGIFITVAFTLLAQSTGIYGTDSSKVMIERIEFSRENSTNRQIVGYYPNWSWYRRGNLVNPETIFYEKYTVINYAFFEPLASGHIVSSDTWADDNLLLGPFIWWPEQGNDHTRSLPYLAAQAGVKLLPSIGGWTLSSHFPTIAADPQKRQIFIQDCVYLIETYGFNGIDLDWEYPGYAPHNGSEADTDNFTLLLQELRTALDSLETVNSTDYLLTSCFGASESLMSYIDWENVIPHLDMVNLMSYDFHGSWDDLSNHHTPLYPTLYGSPSWCVEGAFHLLTNTFDVPAEKINIGLAFYGKALANCTELYGSHTGYDTVTFSTDLGQPHFYSISEQIDSFTYYWDSQVECPYLLGISINTFVTYDNEESISLKAQFAVDNNTFGVIIWELTGDYLETYPGSGVIMGTSLVDAVLDIFENSEIPPKAPVNIEIEIFSGDIHLSWDEVTEDIYGEPIEVGSYRIFFKNPDIESDVFVLLGETNNTSFVHENAGSNYRILYYKIRAVR